MVPSNQADDCVSGSQAGQAAKLVADKEGTAGSRSGFGLILKLSARLQHGVLEGRLANENAGFLTR